MPRLRLGALAAACGCAIAAVPTAALTHAASTGSGTAAPAAEPSIVEGSFASPQVRGTLRYRAYLPARYAGSGQRYPVIYLLHGLPNPGTNYRDGKMAAVGAAAERAGRPAIVIATQASRAGDTDPEFHDWGPGRNWESAIAADLVRAVDRRFRTIVAPRGRALLGVSAGGYGATIIALHHPRVFSVAQAWSGYFAPTDPAGRPLSVGDAGADRRASAHSYVGWLAKTRAVRLQFYAGDHDARFVADNRRLHSELARAGVPHEFGVYPGGHSEAFWASHRRDWVTALVRALGGAV